MIFLAMENQTLLTILSGGKKIINLFPQQRIVLWPAFFPIAHEVINKKRFMNLIVFLGVHVFYIKNTRITEVYS